MKSPPRPALGREGLQQEELVIARVEAIDDAPDEPALAAIEDR